MGQWGLLAIILAVVLGAVAVIYMGDRAAGEAIAECENSGNVGMRYGNYVLCFKADSLVSTTRIQ